MLEQKGGNGGNFEQCYWKILQYKKPTKRRSKEKDLSKNATLTAVYPSVNDIELLSSFLSSLSCQSSASSKSSVSSVSGDSSSDELLVILPLFCQMTFISCIKAFRVQ